MYNEAISGFFFSFFFLHITPVDFVHFSLRLLFNSSTSLILASAPNVIRQFVLFCLQGERGLPGPLGSSGPDGAAVSLVII